MAGHFKRVGLRYTAIRGTRPGRNQGKRAQGGRKIVEKSSSSVTWAKTRLFSDAELFLDQAVKKPPLLNVVVLPKKVWRGHDMVLQLRGH